MSNKINIIKSDGSKQPLDVTKIHKMSHNATDGLTGVDPSILELDSQIKFIDGMTSADIQDALIRTAVEKIDVDVPNWTFVAARLVLFDLYHSVNRKINNTKSNMYPHLIHYIKYASQASNMWYQIGDGYDLNDLNEYIVPDRDFQFTYLGIKTLKDRYLLKNKNNEICELPQLMFMSIAMFLACNEENKQEKAKEFYDVISKFEVMLATPTLSNARTQRHQLSSCYVGSTPDSIEGIFDSFKEMALLSKFGGGIGWDWNSIRGLGGVIDGYKGAAGGTVPFFKITNDIALAVDQLGTRKGAIAVYLEPWHIDIDDFIDLKKNSGEERRRAHDLFPALWLNDLFGERVRDDDIWTLFDPKDVPDLSCTFGEEFNKAYKAYESNEQIRKVTMKAKDLWKKILRSYFESGSPFLCFKDTANVRNPNSHAGVIRSSNLCTEIYQNTSPDSERTKVTFENNSVLYYDKDDQVVVSTHVKPASKLTSLDIIGNNKVAVVEKERVVGNTAVCNLASINLSKIHTKADIERVVPIAMRMLDNVVSLNYYPYAKVRDTNMNSRAVGLGVMGEAQMIAEQQIMWGSTDHLNKIDSIMEAISYNAIDASADLASERGYYPGFEGSAWSKGILPIDTANKYAKELTSRPLEYDWDKLKTKVITCGIRNGYLMAIAPTSSISILVGTSQAIEPIYKRKWFEENLSGQIPVTAPNLNPDTWNYYTPAYDVEQLDVIKAAAVRQKWIDQGQSVNIFMRLDKSNGKYLNDIYMLGWKLGLKSTYYLRSQSPEAVQKVDVADRSMECQGCQ